jgi:transcriptional regulator with XRE-family HTH domain
VARNIRYTRNMSKTQLFVANINSLIEAGDISISEVARRAGIARPDLSHVLNGSQGLTIDRAEKIAHAVNVPLDVLLAGPVEAHAVA